MLMSNTAVAVSGGPDSMGLALLLNRWAKTANVRLIGVTVDHRFREESAAETKVLRCCVMRSSDVLSW